MSHMDASPGVGIRSGEPFMLFTGVILTAQTVRGPEGTLTQQTHRKEQKEFFLCVIMKKI